MAERLKKSVETDKKNEQNRKELIAGISHDLRTPLTSIKAYIEGLMEGVASTPQMQQKYMKIILSKANDIDRMVDKLFLFSKLDIGDCPFYPEKLNIRQEILSVVSSVEKEYHQKGMNIHCEDIPADLYVYADPVQLHNAVTNILENSLKNKEYELLLFLVTNADMVFDKETLYERIWGMDAVGDNATVAVHINRLREKIEDNLADPHYIETVWGAGYRFKA